jgi:hypothetical protein
LGTVTCGPRTNYGPAFVAAKLHVVPFHHDNNAATTIDAGSGAMRNNWHPAGEFGADVAVHERYSTSLSIDRVRWLFGMWRALRTAVPTRIRNSAEVYRADERLPARDPWIEKLAYLMDGSIPIGRWSIGLDPLLGLVPGFGDLIGALISMLIVVRAVQAGIPRIAVARMMTNVAIDTLIGAIPVAGDLFDFVYKSNLKNLRIYEESLYARRDAAARHWGFFIALFVGIAVAVSAVLFGVIALVRTIW